MTTTQYVGARYVPLFKGEWDNTQTYEPLCIVSNQGNSYTSRQYVPMGINIDNEEYWALTGNYNAQVEAYREELATFVNDYNQHTNFINPHEVEGENDDARIKNALLLSRTTNTPIMLSGIFTLNNTLNLEYADNIYVANKSKIISSASPAIFIGNENIELNRNLISGGVLTIENSNTDVKRNTASIGVEVENGSVVTINNLTISFFGIGILINNSNNYIQTYNNVHIYRCYHGVVYNSENNSGEQLSFNNCLFDHCYKAFVLNSIIAELNIIESEIDFCQCGIYIYKQLPVANIMLTHIEGLGYYGQDMPKDEGDYYAYLVYNSNENEYAINHFNISSCTFHVTQMQKIIGLHTMIYDRYSITNISNCVLNSMGVGTLTIKAFSTGYCNRGIYEANSALIGSSKTLNVNIEGPYWSETNQTLTYRDSSDSTLKNLFNIVWLNLGETSSYIFDTTQTNAYIAQSGGDRISSGKVAVKKNISSVKCSVSSNGSIVFNGVYPVDWK